MSEEFEWPLAEYVSVIVGVVLIKPMSGPLNMDPFQCRAFVTMFESLRLSMSNSVFSGIKCFHGCGCV